MNATNCILREIGFRPDDRVVVVHADDIGMCHATLPAIDEVMAFGLVTSTSAMVPCPWFPEVVAWHHRNPQFDLGIHLTSTSEWERHRWGPISTRAEASGRLTRNAAIQVATFLTTTASYEDWLVWNLMTSVGIPLRSDSRFNYNCERWPAQNNDQITCHLCSEQRMREIHQELHRSKLVPPEQE